MSVTGEKRSCKATTKAGTACQAVVLIGSDYCVSHQDRETKEKLGFLGHGKGGRKRRPREVDVIRERIEERSGEIFGALWEALRAERPVVVGNGPSARVELVRDFPTSIMAARELLDRGYGRPKQSSEHTILTRDAFLEAVAKWEAELAELESGANGGPGDTPGDRARQECS